MENPLDLLWLAPISFAIGAALAWLVARVRWSTALARQQAEATTQLQISAERIRLLDAEVERQHVQRDALRADIERWRQLADSAAQERATFAERAERLPILDARLSETESALAAAQREASELREANGRLQTELSGEREQLKEKLALLDEAKRSLSDQFKTLANDILEEKGKRFAELSQSNLGKLLGPFNEKLSEFRTRVDTIYGDDTRERSALAEQVKQLLQLNQTLSQDARNLTSALKGSNKTQGNWGELILERVLEDSGLRKGHEYRTQQSHALEGGGRAQPDVIIALPENRSLVVDAKASLSAYDEYAAAEDDAGRGVALARHLQSVRAHIRGLAGKNYQTLYQLESLDFVLMFIPIEPAFMLAVSHDQKLFMDAWHQNVLLVSPSTLLFVLRTVEHLWRQEAQSQNAKEIARRGGELYDRLVAFTQDLEKVGERLQQAQESFQDARNKLGKNRGNVIRQAEMLRELGVKPNKKLPPALLELDESGGEASPPALAPDADER
ncbi:MAG: DNA recombination protein RmuC [Gammaproteobacteria bacterium HGW-Gammaproteobacteria-4]|jgi:DNA recombination protein RmuC|nr:MAG: DNA recombination protein RmuC [Gammaproteobacteria bacterium HGW-Gammaproteobacteria-4]